MALYVGLMSGTSLDGVDGVLCELHDDDLRVVRTLAHRHLPMPDELLRELAALNTAQGQDELHRAALAGNALAALYAECVDALRRHAAAAAVDVAAIGAHGQTVRHRPREFDGRGYTLQLLNGAMLAELTGIDVVCDFRSADVAAGGQGAPLVPAFHAACFGGHARTRVVLNLGGIANVTVLDAAGGVSGFDCGPGNVLLDAWSREAYGVGYDRDGDIAAGGRVLPELLAALRAEPYFALPPPKSTGRDLFHAQWLRERLRGAADAAKADVMATLAELTALVVADAVRDCAVACNELLACGGGAANAHLMARIAQALPDVAVATTASVGVPIDHVEALAFAWLAARRLKRESGSLPAVTGARGERVLGAWYAAPSV